MEEISKRLTDMLEIVRAYANRCKADYIIPDNYSLVEIIDMLEYIQSGDKKGH